MSAPSLVVFRHEVRLLRREVFTLFMVLVTPIVLITVTSSSFGPVLEEAGYPGASGAEQVVPGYSTMLAFFIVSLVGFPFFFEYSWCTWDRVRVSPASSAAIVTSKALPRFVLVLIQFTAVFTAGVLVYDLTIAGPWPALIPVVLAFASCLIGIGLLLTAVCRSAQQMSVLSSVMVVVFGAVGGALVPLDTLPDWLQHIAPATPTYWAMRGYLAVILDGQGLSAVLLPSAVLFGTGAACAAIAAWRFKFEESKPWV